MARKKEEGSSKPLLEDDGVVFSIDDEDELEESSALATANGRANGQVNGSGFKDYEEGFREGEREWDDRGGSGRSRPDRTERLNVGPPLRSMVESRETRMSLDYV
jgi:hypothetical protein